MVSFENRFLQALQLHSQLFRTFFSDGSLNFVFPSFPIALFRFLLLLRLFFGLYDFFSILRFVVVWLILFRWSILAPVFVHFTDATGMGFVIGSSESFGAINTNESCRSASAHDMLIALCLFQSNIAVLTNKSYHNAVVEIL
jgi:hypothetical protein